MGMRASIVVVASVVSGCGVVGDPGGVTTSEHAAPPAASGAEFGMNQTVTAAQLHPNVAWNGSNYLVVWQDQRNGPQYDIYATLVSPAGVIGNAAGIGIETASETAELPTVASNGTDFLVTWDDHRLGAYNIYGARVLANGTVVDPGGFAIDEAANDRFRPAVAWDGSAYVVVWDDRRSDAMGEIYTRRVDASGTPLGTDAVPVSTASTTGAFEPWVACAAASCLAVWYDYRAGNPGVYGARLTAGAVDPPDGFVISGGAFDHFLPKVASDGANYLTVWYDHRDGNHFHIVGSEVLANGTVQQPAGIAISTTGTANDELEPTIAWGGASYLVAWEQDVSFDLAGRQLSATGAFVGGEIALASNADSRPRLVAGPPGQDLLAFDDRTNTLAKARFVSGCGNGVVDAGETCDDGGFGNGDGCSSTCSIESGYTCSGTPSVCTDIDECTAGTANCTQVCINTPGAFTCACNSGYTLDANGYACNDVDECATGNGGCAQVCTNMVGTYACSCGAGYTLAGDGHACPDIDECATANGGCAQTCTNTQGSYACSCGAGYMLDADGHACDACPAGYSGDGVTCQDIDECATDNGDCAQHCTNLPGSYACSCDAGYGLDGDDHSCDLCPAGYVGNGVTCDDIDECATGNGGCAQTCTNTGGAYTCSCAPGYTLAADGHACDDIDECAANVCDPAVTCTNTPGSYTCGACPAGYTGDGTACIEHSGCGCHSTDPRGSLGLALAIGFVLRRRRRA
jgi:fibulin 1/2